MTALVARCEHRSVVAALLMLPACRADQPETTASSEGSVSSQTSGDSGDDADALLEDLAQGFCDHLAECGCDTVNPGGFPSGNQCVPTALGDLRGILDAGVEAALVFDPECLTARFERFARVGCDPGWSAAGPRQWCKVHYGDRPLGAECNASDNAEGDDCERGLACFESACVEAPQTEDEDYEPGERCYDEHPYCFEGFCMDAGNGERVCVLSPGADEPCLVGNCAPGLVCDADDVCIVGGSLGAECNETALCERCLECGGTEPGVCTLPPPVSVGGDCSEDLDCVDGAWCDEAEGGRCSTDPVACWETAQRPVSVISRSRTCAHL